jgi:hypothetical protein
MLFEVIVIQLALLEACHTQRLSVVICTLPLPPAAATLVCEGEIV